ncbi:hypothetical protein Pelo_9941 [Pelomyxa schiedti]|nr:hypothetical protein Pelo_9941 [Pelomyxa schiedti]
MPHRSVLRHSPRPIPPPLRRQQRRLPRRRRRRPRRRGGQSTGANILHRQGHPSVPYKVIYQALSQKLGRNMRRDLSANIKVKHHQRCIHVAPRDAARVIGNFFSITWNNETYQMSLCPKNKQPSPEVQDTPISPPPPKVPRLTQQLTQQQDHRQQQQELQLQKQQQEQVQQQLQLQQHKQLELKLELEKEAQEQQQQQLEPQRMQLQQQQEQRQIQQPQSISELLQSTYPDLWIEPESLCCMRFFGSGYITNTKKCKNADGCLLILFFF